MGGCRTRDRLGDTVAVGPSRDVSMTSREGEGKRAEGGSTGLSGGGPIGYVGGCLDRLPQAT
jgi:hypothetical protein